MKWEHELDDQDKWTVDPPAEDGSYWLAKPDVPGFVIGHFFESRWYLLGPSMPISHEEAISRGYLRFADAVEPPLAPRGVKVNG